MPKYKATKNFYMDQADQHFSENQTYDLQVSEADEINKKIEAAFGEKWLERVDEDKKGSKTAETAS